MRLKFLSLVGEGALVPMEVKIMPSVKRGAYSMAESSACIISSDLSSNVNQLRN